jgi:hypothetical protein
MSTEHDPPREGEAAGEPYDDRAAESPGRSEPEAPVSEPVPGSTASKAAERSAARRAKRKESPNMLPGRKVRRSAFESLLVRLIATCGIVGIGVAIAAIMVSSKSQGWVVGLVVSIVSVILAAILWSSRTL